MSILNFFHSERATLILSDSLASEGAGIPFLFVTKVHPLPHLNTLVCGTGSLNTVMNWLNFIQLNVIASDINDLNEVSPENIKRIYQETTGTNGPFTTIYQFGYSEKTNKNHGYCYRSTNGFVGESVQEGFGVKPGDGIDVESIVRSRSDDINAAFKQICLKQQEVDMAKTGSDRLGVGGSVYMYSLKGKMISIEHSFDFPNKGSDEQQIRSRGLFKERPQERVE